MRNHLIAAAAAAVLTSPATAQDNSPYIGIEGGVLFPQKQNLDGSVDFTNPAAPDIGRGRIGSLRGKTGFDVDIFGGYDFGMFRLEGELGYKQAKLKNLQVNPAFVAALNKGGGTSFTGASFDLGRKTDIYSAMVNGYVKHELFNDITGFVGAGAGYASVHEFGDKKGAFAWQLLAGLEKPVSRHIDAGIKYRYFRTGKLDFDDGFTFNPGAGVCGTAPCSGGTASFNSHDNYSSHSVLASLTYNFGGSEAPPPPPPPPVVAREPIAPATQTCADGSGILPGGTCPLPPAPPPPAPSPTARGERGN